ncbi:MAG: hypothetical protein ABIJ46_01620 [bacterium]
MDFGDFAEKFGRLGIDRDKLPEMIPEKLMFDRESIPEDLAASLTRVLSKLDKLNMDMPFLHITPTMTIDQLGVGSPTGFDQSIVDRGLDRNTSGSVFVDRDPNRNWKEAMPGYFADRPEVLIEDIRKAVQNFIHHGVRTNKASLGFRSRRGSREADYAAQGRGVPVLMVADQTGISRRRGVDGIEHYITDERMPRDRIMGKLEIADLNMEDRDDVAKLVEEFSKLVEDYADRKLGIVAS